MDGSERPHSWDELPTPSPDLAEPVVAWFKDYGRTYPWRRTTDPYPILCAELMLQRTRADQVAPVFKDYCNKFDGPSDVLSAGKGAVEDIFAKLGLRWRVEHFWDLQQALATGLGGDVPREKEQLMSLPGVGQYAATATRVFAFGERETVVDSNVLRILGRWYGIDFPDHARRSPRVARWASAHAPKEVEKIRAFNWGLIDHGAAVCTPRNPACSTCPIKENCWYTTIGTN